jgi:hypothetical protein
MRNGSCLWRATASHQTDYVVMSETAQVSTWQTRVRKAVVILLTGIFFDSLGFCIWLDRHFYWTRPREPQPQSGRIYQRVIHSGTWVYLTRIETLPYDYSYVIALFAIAAAILNQR